MEGHYCLKPHYVVRSILGRELFLHGTSLYGGSVWGFSV